VIKIENDSVLLNESVHLVIEELFPKVNPYSISTFIKDDWKLIIILRGSEIVTEIPVEEDEWEPINWDNRRNLKWQMLHEN